MCNQVYSDEPVCIFNENFWPQCLELFIMTINHIYLLGLECFSAMSVCIKCLSTSAFHTGKIIYR